MVYNGTMYRPNSGTMSRYDVPGTLIIHDKFKIHLTLLFQHEKKIIIMQFSKDFNSDQNGYN